MTLMDAPRIAFAEQGLVLVPAKPTGEMLRSLVDAGGDRICDDGTGHYFRNEAKAICYGKQVWAAMTRIASTFR